MTELDLKHLTIIPDDRTIYVNRQALLLDYNIDPTVHAVQWDHDLKLGHIEFKQTQDESSASVPNEALAGIDDYNTYIKPYFGLWVAENERLQNQGEGE